MTAGLGVDFSSPRKGIYVYRVLLGGSAFRQIKDFKN